MSNDGLIWEASSESEIRSPIVAALAGRVFLLLVMTAVLPTALEGATTASVAPLRGYHSRPCGFDMNRNGIFGEPGDCHVCDGTTADPDDDGQNEDTIYIDCDTGSDEPACGSPGSPCRSIGYAWSTRADGPGDGAEDILCFRGVCTDTELVGPRQSGLAATYVVPASGSQSRDWTYPEHPTMLVGWDSDADGEYPPYDADDTSILDGTTLATRPFSLTDDSDYVEMGHFQVQDYGKPGAGSSDSGFLTFQSNPGALEYAYIHDLTLLRINRDRERSSDVSFLNLFGDMRYRWIQLANLDIVQNGSWFARGASPDTGPDDGPIRFINITRTARSCSYSTCADQAGASAFKIWGYVSGIEILDSVWDYAVDEWEPRLGWAVYVSQCSQDWVVRNNEFLDYRTAIRIKGAQTGYCDDAVARPVDNIVFDGNRISYGDYWGPLFGDIAIEVLENEGDFPGEVVGAVEITNNLVWARGELDGCIAVKSGHTSALVKPGTVTVANNTCYGETQRGNLGHFVFGYEDATKNQPSMADIVFKNNISAGLPSGNFPFNLNNVRVTYTPTVFISDFNVFDPNGKFTWVGDIDYGTLEEWKMATGQDASSKSCEPIVADELSGNVHLAAADTCALDSGSTVAGISERDVDGQPRSLSPPWDVGGDEFGEPIFGNGFEEGSTISWSRASQ